MLETVATFKKPSRVACVTIEAGPLSRVSPPGRESALGREDVNALRL